MSNESKYSLGIDLGTTNTALAFIDHEQESASPQSYDIAQLTDQSRVESKNTLPSFLYHATETEQQNQTFKLPWNSEIATPVGEFAKQQGEKVPQRVTQSAKSWLCTPNGQNQAVLPLNAADDIQKQSAVAVSAAYLKHLRDAWNQEHPEHSLQQQQLTLTVPASFDAVARDLTLDAARQAGLSQVTLIEEPIAAFYAWIAQHQAEWRDLVSVNDVVLVCDIGGGTTDFSLITVSESDGNLELTRVSVGEHILLGGDNMDLALAHHLQLKLKEQGKEIAQWQFLGLAHGCRKAKEQLLSDEQLEKVSVVVPSRSSQLLGGTLSVDLTQQDVEQVLLNGFLQPCAIEDHPQSTTRLGLRTTGLDYAQDSNILKHLAKFLSKSRQFLDPQSELYEATQNQSFLHPTTVLFNGGVSKSSVLQNRILEGLNQWLEADNGKAVEALPVQDLDLAVSLGASYYGQVTRGEGIRIKSATACSYYIGVESSMPTIPGVPAFLNGLCVVPVGMEEGSSVDLPETEFGLVVGEPVQFPFFIARERPQDTPGMLVENANEHLEELNTLEISLNHELSEEQQQKVIPVRLRAVLTELGALEIWCDAQDESDQWKLEFHLREQESNDPN